MNASTGRSSAVSSARAASMGALPWCRRLLVLFLTPVACGQGVSFTDRLQSRGLYATDGDGGSAAADPAADPAASADATNGNGPGTGTDTSGAPGQEDTTGDGDGDGDEPGPPPNVPGADEGDLPALHRCMEKWGELPFGDAVQHYRKIAASVSVGGIGNVVTDTERTDEPFLVLIEAGVNVLGTPTYSLMNPNGYYCIKVNVNVLTSLTVKLHCNARLADSEVNVNVGSTQTDTTAGVGVHVLSTVTVQTERPAGDECIR